MGRRICVGCGTFPLLNWENYDINPPSEKDCPNAAHILKGNLLEIDYSGAETVFAGHVVEHLDPEDAHKFIRRVRMQAPSATLILVIPVLDRCDRPSVNFELLQQIVSHYDMHPNAPYGIAHRSWWRTRDVVGAIKAAGYTKIDEWPDCPWLVAQVDWQAVFKCN